MLATYAEWVIFIMSFLLLITLLIAALKLVNVAGKLEERIDKK